MQETFINNLRGASFLLKQLPVLGTAASRRVVYVLKSGEPQRRESSLGIHTFAKVLDRHLSSLIRPGEPLDNEKRVRTSAAMDAYGNYTRVMRKCSKTIDTCFPIIWLGSFANLRLSACDSPEPMPTGVPGVG